MPKECVRKNSGFTLIEVVIVVGVLSLIFGLTAFGVSRIQNTFSAGSADAAVIDVLATAARRATAGQNQSAWGVYLPYNESTRRMENAVIFSGDSYSARDQSRDQEFPFPSSAKLTDVSLSGAGSSDGNDHEIVFKALSGKTDDYGSITVEAFGEERIIEVSPEGIMTREL